MDLTFVTTGDGSQTLFHPEIGEHYHSRHGAWQESRHVFLQSGLQYFLNSQPDQKEASILEIGFGTGLNFLLTADFANQQNIMLDYCGVEAFPLPLEIITKTGYQQYVQPETWDTFISHYEESLKETAQLNPSVQLKIAYQKVLHFTTEKTFDVIYFDAFAAIHQPEMWTDEVLKHVCQYLNKGGVFVTYAITGNLKRSMKALGFEIEKALGAPGKREMLRAVKME